MTRGARYQVRRGTLPYLKDGITATDEFTEDRLWGDGETFLIKDANIAVMKNKVDGDNVFVNLGEGLSTSFLPSAVKSALLDMRNWEGENFLIDINIIKGQFQTLYGAGIMFDELHNLDLHFYYVYKEGKIYRYPKMCYHQRNDKLFLMKDGVGTHFTFKELMDGKALEGDWHNSKVTRWEGHTGVLTQTDINKMPIYNAYFNRIEWHNYTQILNSGLSKSYKNFEINVFLNHFSAKNHFFKIGNHNIYNRTWFFKLYKKMSYRDSMNTHNYFTPENMVKRNLTLKSEENVVKYFEDGVKKWEKDLGYTAYITAGSLAGGFNPNYKGFASVAKLKFKCNGNVILDLQI